MTGGSASLVLGILCPLPHLAPAWLCLSRLLWGSLSLCVLRLADQLFWKGPLKCGAVHQGRTLRHPCPDAPLQEQFSSPGEGGRKRRPRLSLTVGCQQSPAWLTLKDAGSLPS